MIQLFRKRGVWLPTWPTLLIMAAASGLATWLFIANIHPFLSLTAPAAGAKILVVEGWIPDTAMEEILEDYQPGKPYEYICTTGATLPKGYHLSEYKNYAELSARTIESLGVPAERILVAPSASHLRDRTYHSALAFLKKRQSTEIDILREAIAIDVLSHGIHGRRTRTVYQKIFGDGVEVGIISPDTFEYDPDWWFTTSEGVKSIITETISLGFEWMRNRDREE